MAKGLNLSLASSNYLSSDGSLESLNMVRKSENVSILKGGTISVDAGIDTNIKCDNTKESTFAMEAKYKQKFTDNIRGYVRYRRLGDTNQLRAAAGASFPVGDNISLYGDVHYTTKFTEGKDRFGGWVGADLKCGKNLSCWAEVQKNFNPDKMTFKGWEQGQWAVNAGITYKF